MSHKFMHIGMMFPGAPRQLIIDQALNQIGDQWVRYSQWSWLIWTERAPKDIFELLKAQLGKDDQMLIAEFDANNSYGRLPPWIWQWISTREQPRPPTLDELIAKIAPYPAQTNALLPPGLSGVYPPGWQPFPPAGLGAGLPPPSPDTTAEALAKLSKIFSKK